MTHKFLAYDLEIAVEIPEGLDDWRKARPLGITCAAAMDHEGGLSTWHSAYNAETGRYAPRMTPAEVQQMSMSLHSAHQDGYKIVTWNGLGFDLDVLAEECQDNEWDVALATLAMDHIDMAFLMVCQMGYMIGLETCAKALRLSGKLVGMSGGLAPVEWKKTREEQEKTLDYVRQDAVTTAEVYQALLAKGQVFWTTKKGRRSRYPWIPKQIMTDGPPRMMTVQEALALPESDTSWMTNPRERRDYYRWAAEVLSSIPQRP